ncbi:MAG: hypothetical protein AB1349_05450 [Elusimicrobiota bacterium]
MVRWRDGKVERWLGRKAGRRLGRLAVLLITLPTYQLINCLYSQDVKAKLNSADGSTSFQVRDSADVVVSSITSDGDAHFNTGKFNATGATTFGITTSSGINIQAGSLIADADDKLRISLGTTTVNGNLNIQVGALTDLTVESADLVVTSTAIFATDTVSVDQAADSFVYVPGLSGTLYVSTGPAMIFANTAIPVKNSDSAQWTRCRMKIYVVDPGGNWIEIAFNDGVFPAGNANSNIAMSTCGGLRVTTVGSYQVIVQWTDEGWAGTCQTTGGRSLYTFWMGCK